jgi:uncharacterized protein with HEPN domain
MMERAVFRIKDILEAIEQILNLVQDSNFTSFAADRMRIAAFERFVEIISEASRHVPEELKAGTPEIEWHNIANIGNHLRHAYHRTDPGILWNLYEQGHLMRLREACQAFLRGAE